ncbi:MAG: hypothetical protein WCY01_00650 [Alkalispirochaeta sp.]|jgi:hypothetical protein
MRDGNTFQKKVRVGLPIVLSLAILGATVYRITVQTDQKSAVTSASDFRGGLDNGTDAGTDTGETALRPPTLQLPELPCSSSVITHGVIRTPRGFQHDLQWSVPDQDVLELLAFLERDTRSLRYQAERRDHRWYVEAQITDGPGVVLRETGDTWQEGVAPAFGFTSPPRSGSSGAEKTTPRSDGGMGYVRFEDRRTMYWLWDAEVLCLEPSR